MPILHSLKGNPVKILFKSNTASFPIWDGEATAAEAALEHKARFFQVNYGFHISKPSPNVIDLSIPMSRGERRRIASLVVAE